jgi:hypothetical protein
LLGCCPINVTEVYMGMRPEEAGKTDEFLASLEFYPVTWEIATAHCIANGVKKDMLWRCRTS